MVMVAWGHYSFNSGEKAENVVISFYSESQLPMVAHGIQHVSGIDVVFFTLPEYLPRFEGKVIDHAPDRSFFLRKP